MNKKETHIIILGGGYAGIMAAVRLSGRTRKMAQIKITLISGLANFVERPLLHQEAVGSKKVRRQISHMLRGTGVHFLQGWVTALDADQQKVSISQESTTVDLAFDYLIYALGSSTNRQAIPGIERFAYTLDPFGNQTTADLHQRLNKMAEHSGTLAIIGGGPTGVETAAEIKSAFPNQEVFLVSDGQAGSFKGEKVLAHISQALNEQGIIVKNGRRVIAIDDQKISFTDGHLHADLIIWAGGFAAPPPAAEAGIMTNDRRQILVDPYLRSLSHPNIFAAGDAAMALEAPGAPMRMSLYVAVVSGAQAADNMAALLQDKEPQPLSYAWYGQGIALGRKDAVGFLTYPADELSGPILRGRLAVRVRNFFVWMLGASLELERRFPGILFWNGRKRYKKQMQKEKKAHKTNKKRPAATLSKNG